MSNEYYLSHVINKKGSSCKKIKVYTNINMNNIKMEKLDLTRAVHIDPKNLNNCKLLKEVMFNPTSIQNIETCDNIKNALNKEFGGDDMYKIDFMVIVFE